MSHRAAVEEGAGAVLVDRFEGGDPEPGTRIPSISPTILEPVRIRRIRKNSGVRCELCEECRIRDGLHSFAAAQKGCEIVRAQGALDEIKTRGHHTPLLGRLGVVTAACVEEDLVDDEVDVRLDRSQLPPSLLLISRLHLLLRCCWS